MSNPREFDLDTMDTTTKGDGPAVVAGDDFDPTLASDDIEITKRRDELFNDDHIPCTLEWRDLKYVVQQKTRELNILKGCSGVVNPGQVLAIMGASGAGKTTLLNLLAGRLAPSGNGTATGSVLVNGQKRNFDTFRLLSAYVLQQDNFFAEMTVKETLTLSARLRLPSAMPLADKLAKVEAIISELGLRKCQDTIVGNELIRGVSGGERKRVNVGTELVTSPSLLFLDEPTTGLDAFNAQNVMSTMLQLARAQRTVVSTIHQPRSNIFQMFDQLLLLSEGAVMYFGPGKDAVAYFSRLGYACPSSYNPADYFLDLISLDQRSAKLETSSRKRISSLADKFDEHLKSNPLPVSPVAAMEADFAKSTKAPKYATSLWTQFVLLTKRSWNVQLREKATNISMVFQTIFFAIILGMIWLGEGSKSNGTSIQATAGALFFILVNQAFGGVFGIIFLFPTERVIVLKERASRAYHVGAYFWSKTVSELPRTTIVALVFSVISYFMIELRDSFGRFILFFLIITLTTLNSEGLALCVSAIAKDPQAAGALAPVFIVTSMLFGGFFIGVNLIPVWLSWLRYLSFLKYGFAAAMQNQFESRTLNSQADCDASNSTNFCPLTGEDVLEFYDVQELSLAENMFVMIGMFLALRLLAYFILRSRGPKYDNTI